MPPETMMGRFRDLYLVILLLISLLNLASSISLLPEFNSSLEDIYTSEKQVKL